ncbi:MAG: aminoacyl-tRNA hydrolase [Ignavibacteria bacterium]|nr:aminoacyl-tRNA hydrolase [Ignavibacteria bacterium]
MKKEVDLLIVGLGNHSDIYLETRHNIGWMVASAFVQKHKGNFIPFAPEYYLANVTFAGKNILALLPRTYMNNSGLAVKLATKKFNIQSENILVVCDEYNFPLGKIHLKDSGGDGGHNGVASIIEHLQTQNFLRLRCGIGRNFGKNELVDYVLSPFEPEEIPIRDAMINRAIDAIEYLLIKGKSRAMSDVNSEKLWKIEPDNKK